MMTKKPRVAVLGAGIMGSSTALYLARAGVDVSLFDAATAPFSAASRWNEGKIHLGYIYAGDPTLNTARKILPGGLVFKNMVENLIGASIEPVITAIDDIYLCHKDSVVNPNAMRVYFDAVSKMIREHPDATNYLVDVSNCRTQQLTKKELANISDSADIQAGFHVPERSVSTVWIADRFNKVLRSEARIKSFMNTRITQVCPENKGGIDGKWCVKSGDEEYGSFDYVINSLWEGKIAIDQTAGMELPPSWTNRYRLSLFLRTSKELALSSAIVATGPFGDIKNYNNRDFYLSWYPKGLIMESTEIQPPSMKNLNEVEKQALFEGVVSELGDLIPGVVSIRDHVEKMEVQGGWVYAQGHGKLSDPNSSLHRRSDFGIAQRGSYISVDTGKYSTAPWLARKVANVILQAT